MSVFYFRTPSRKSQALSLLKGIAVRKPIKLRPTLGTVLESVHIHATISTAVTFDKVLPRMYTVLSQLIRTNYFGQTYQAVECCFDGLVENLCKWALLQKTHPAENTSQTFMH